MLWLVVLSAFLIYDRVQKNERRPASQGHPDGINAGEFGAKGNGTTDDSKALQAALDAAAASGICFIPAGNYHLTEVLKIPSHCRVIGAGGEKTVLRQATSDRGVFLVDSASGVGIEELGMHGQAAPAITVRCTTADVYGFRARNLQIHSLGPTGTGIAIECSARGFVAFPFFENVTISGGNVHEHAQKTGIRIGGSSGSHVVGATFIGCRVWRTNVGIYLANCDSVRAFNTAMDDIDGVGVLFGSADMNTLFMRFEDKTIPKYVDFGASADNRVYGIPGNATLLEVVDHGVRNSWDGSDGSGGRINRTANPRELTGNTILGQRVVIADDVAGSPATWQRFELDASRAKNIHSIGRQSSYFQQVGGLVTWYLRVQFIAAHADEPVALPLPLPPHDAAYVDPSGGDSVCFMGLARGAAGKYTATSMQFDGASGGRTVIIMPPDGHWSNGAEGSGIQATLTYKAAGYTQ